MRDYGVVSPKFWTDFRGQRWRVSTSHRRLKFAYPAHAALRAHVFHRDDFRCRQCGAEAVDVPANYDGRNCLWTNTRLKDGWRDVLILDHILTLKAGGRNVVENLQALCETCNKRKQKYDRAMTAAYRSAA